MELLVGAALLLVTNQAALVPFLRRTHHLLRLCLLSGVVMEQRQGDVDCLQCATFVVVFVASIVMVGVAEADATPMVPRCALWIGVLACNVLQNIVVCNLADLCRDLISARAQTQPVQV
jgi:hypothetical protein